MKTMNFVFIAVVTLTIVSCTSGSEISSNSSLGGVVGNPLSLYDSGFDTVSERIVGTLYDAPETHVMEFDTNFGPKKFDEKIFDKAVSFTSVSSSENTKLQLFSCTRVTEAPLVRFFNPFIDVQDISEDIQMALRACFNRIYREALPGEDIPGMYIDGKDPEVYYINFKHHADETRFFKQMFGFAKHDIVKYLLMYFWTQGGLMTASQLDVNSKDSPAAIPYYKQDAYKGD